MNTNSPNNDFILIKTLTISQLLKRWNNNYSLENIYELANQGHFGIYFRITQKRRTYHDIEEHIKTFPELQSQFHNFINNHPFLLQEKIGYERLATDEEEKIFGLCDSGSINRILRNRKITPLFYNNTFGFVKNENNYVVNSYYRNPNYNFTTENDCFVFIDQIEQFEKCPKFVDFFNKKKFLTNDRDINEKLSNNIELHNYEMIQSKIIKSSSGIADQYVFKKIFDINTKKIGWHIVYAGKSLPFLYYDGLLYISVLIKEPCKVFSATELYDIAMWCSPENTTLLQNQEIKNIYKTNNKKKRTSNNNLSQQSTKSLKQAKSILEEQIEEELRKEKFHQDIEAITDWHEQLTTINDELINRLPSKKKYDAVHRSIKNIQNKLKKISPELHEHFIRNLHYNNGKFYYKKDDDLAWNF